MNLDETDKKILKYLMINARQSARQISLKLGISTFTVISRIKRLEKEKIIKGYTTVINHEKIGYTLTAIIEIMAKNDKVVDIEEEISKIENICGVYDVTGSTDTMIIAKFKERQELSKFVKDLATIPNVKNTITHVVLNTAKEDFRLA